MAAGNAYNTDYFVSATSNVPLNGSWPGRANAGAQTIMVNAVVPTTSTDDATDFYGLCPVASGRKLVGAIHQASDGDTGGTSMDLDIILRTYNSAGTATDVILYNAGTAYTAAQATSFLEWNTIVPRSEGGYGIIGLYCNVAATTGAAITLGLEVQIN